MIVAVLEGMPNNMLQYPYIYMKKTSKKFRHIGIFLEMEYLMLATYKKLPIFPLILGMN